VHNRAFPKGSIIEGNSTEEVVDCCQEYLKGQRGIGKPDYRHKGRLARKGTKGRKVFIDQDYKEVNQAHYSVLRSTKVMHPYIDEHLDVLREESNGCTEDWVMKQHKH
jgi:hypothetical protein